MSHLPIQNFSLFACARHKLIAALSAVTFLFGGTPVFAVTSTFTANGSWTAPAGVTSVTVEAWGGGGGGGAATGIGATTASQGGGGAGGQYVSKTVTVTPGTVYFYVVGAGGAAGNASAGGAGGDTTFNTSSVVAKGGAGGGLAAVVNAGGTAGLGTAAGAVGSVIFAGGNGTAGGVAGAACTAGAGGGGAGSTGAGGNATTSTAGTGTANGGGIGGAGRTTSGNGRIGTAAGGGGSGGCATTAVRTGGTGALGQISITYALPPTATTNAASVLTTTSATLNGSVTDNGSVTATAFDYGLTTAYGTSIAATPASIAANAGATVITAAIAGLTCNTLYHFRAKGTNSAGTGVGADMTFTTSACPTAPTVTTNAAGTPTTTGATLNGVVNANGAIATTSFDYGLTTAYGTNLVATPSTAAAAGGNTAITAAVTGLSCGTLYHYRAKGSNSVGTTNGTDLTFTTAACPAPTATTSPASAIVAGGATLNGSVNANGASTTVTFDYGTTTAYGSSSAASPSTLTGSTATAVSASVTGLLCNTLYHYRVKAVSVGGTSNGADATFTTLTCPSVVSINTSSANPTAASTSVAWAVTFSASVTGVDVSDFTLIQAGGVTGASITSVSGSGTTWTVNATTGTGAVGTLTLKLLDNDSIINAAGTPLGGTGAGNGDFAGQAYTLIVPVCNNTMLFCDDFERSVLVGGSNTAGSVGAPPGFGAWTVGPLAAACAGAAGNAGCAGIDADLPPWTTATSPRATSYRAAFTRWSNVVVTSPVINLAGKGGATVSFLLRRGSDCFSEWPGNDPTGCNGVPPAFTSTIGEEFKVEYKNNAGAWLALGQYPSDGPAGETFTPTIDLPDDALHATFQIRFTQPTGSGSGGNGGAPGVVGYDYWHFDNVIVKEKPVVTYVGAFCDTFEGDLARWTMLGTGNASIGSTYFQNGLHDLDLRWNAVSATTKTTDITTATGNITFWVKRGIGAVTTVPNTTGSDFPETGKDLKIDYLNSANAWVTLATFAGGGTAGQVYSPTTTPLTNSFPLPADAKHSKFKLRISMLAGSGLYDTDYWHVDDVCVGTVIAGTDLVMSPMTSSGTFTPGQYVTYNMTVTNNGPNADPGPITITDTLPAGLTFQSGGTGWTCTATGQSVSCSQSGSFAVGTSKSLALTATVDANAAAGNITNTATVGGQTNDTNLANNTVTKTDAVVVPSFVFTDKACTVGVAIGSGTQCNYVKWSPLNAGATLGNIYITAVNGAGVPTPLNTGADTTVNLQFALLCHNPAAGATVQADFSAAPPTGVPPIRVLPVCTAASPTVLIPTTWTTATPFVFVANTPSGSTPVTGSTPSPTAYSFGYADVGNVELYLRNSAATGQVGESGPFIVKPAGYVLSNIKRTSDNLVNPAAADATGAKFMRAGDAFSMTVTAVTTTGAATPSFGKEAIPESVQLTTAGVGVTTVPALSGTFGAFNNGSATGTAFSWGEVGIINLTPSIASATGKYLGSDALRTNDPVDGNGTPSGNIGRFYPDHFNTQLMDGCASCGFTYENQAFTSIVTAVNASGQTTTNYQPPFSKTVALSNASATAGTLTPASLSAAFVAGVATDSTTKFAFTVSPNNGSITLRATETAGDGVSSNPNAVPAPFTLPSEGSTNIRSGRILVGNDHGSEVLPLTLTATLQAFAANGWVTSVTDRSTTLALAATYPVGGGTTAASFSPVAVTGACGTQVVSGTSYCGLWNINLGKPTAKGTATIAPTAPSYLPLTAGRATFGVYKGSNKVIDMRESF